MDSDKIAAAILAAGFAVSQRQALSGGRIEDTLREKYIEFLGFVREQDAAKPAAAKPSASKGSRKPKK